MRTVAFGVIVGVVLTLLYAGVRASLPLGRASGYSVVEADRWPRRAPGGWGPPDRVMTVHHVGVRTRFYSGRVVNSVVVESMDAYDAGLPLPCLSFVVINDASVPMPSGPVPSAPLLIPTRVLWGGLVVDVMFWSFVTVLAVRVVRGIRRWNRRRRGRCPACGYDLQGVDGDVCPECGTVP